MGLTICLFTACHDKLWDAIDDLDVRVARLEELCKEMNTNITSLQTIVDVLQSNDFITGVVEIKKDGEVIGYTITFGKHDPITIYHGQDGKDGADGKDGQDGSANAPVIGVAQDTDGVYYWTLNGEWLLDDNGNKLPVSGKDGQNGTNGSNGQDGADGKDGQDGEDGKDGADGQDGKDGKDGVTPQLKIEDGYWYISYDNGASWTQLGKATGEDGKDGADGENGKDGQNGADGKDGQDGDSMFQSVTQDENYVYFTLADGTVIKIAKGNGTHTQPNGEDYINFEDFNVLKALLNMGVDMNNDCYITYNEAATIDTLIFTGNTSIYCFREFQYFTGIKYFMFKDCSNLFAINLPQNITCINSECFNACKNLKHIQISEECTKICDKAFYNCTTLETVNISEGCTSIGNSTFANCSKLKSINIPESCTTIGTGAFNSCTSLIEISLPSKLTRIEEGSFTNCSSLKRIYIPYSVYYIAENALSGLAVDTLCIPEEYEAELMFNLNNSHLTTIVWNCIHFPTDYYYRNNDAYYYIYKYYGIFAHWVKEDYSNPTNTKYYSGVYNNTITTIIFGEKVGHLPKYLCSGGESLKTVYSKNPTPPTLNNNLVGLNSIENIYVPQESVEQYKAEWSGVAEKIVGYDFE